MHHRIAPPALLVVTLAGLACSTPGRIANRVRDPRAFVTERQWLLVDRAAGLTRVQLDGSAAEILVDAQFGLRAMTADASVIVLGDSDTNLYVLDASRRVRRVPELDGRAGAVAIHPDGTRVAVARHADFTQPQAQWKRSEDDAVWLVDVRTLAVDVVPKSRDELVTQLAWAKEGDALILGMFGSDIVRLDIATRTRTALPQWPSPPIDESARCAQQLVLRGWRGDEGIDLEDSAGALRRLVIVEGRKRGVHDYLHTIRNAFFTASCRSVVFEMEDGVWLVDVVTGDVGLIIRGGDVRALLARR